MPHAREPVPYEVGLSNTGGEGQKYSSLIVTPITPHFYAGKLGHPTLVWEVPLFTVVVDNLPSTKDGAQQTPHRFSRDVVIDVEQGVLLLHTLHHLLPDIVKRQVASEVRNIPEHKYVKHLPEIRYGP